MFGQTALGSASTGQLGLVLEVIIDRNFGPRQSSSCHWWFPEAAALAAVPWAFRAKPPQICWHTLLVQKTL